MKSSGGGALVALLDKGPSGKTPRQPKPAPESGPELEVEVEPEGEGGAFEAAAESFLSLLGVPSAKRASARESLRTMISSCSGESYEKE